ncbi:MAG: hypothetical protein VKK59_06615 [Vampirovibrionales bacterium]|nr:hypothetical protein [Vampirovibrionales bacterium]
MSDAPASLTEISNKVRPIWLAPSASDHLFLACVHRSLQERIGNLMLDFETNAFADAAAEKALDSALALSKTLSSSMASQRIYQYWQRIKQDGASD